MANASLRVVYIDAEPQGKVGGGIRTSLLSAMNLLKAHGIKTLVYSHNPEAYTGHQVRALQRRPWPSGWARPLRRLAYGYCHEQAIAFGISAWLAETLARDHTPQSHYEFCDYEGYAFHSLQVAALRSCSAIRLHTPHYLARAAQKKPDIGDRILRWRELHCLRRAIKVLVPSPHFASEHFCDLTAETCYNVPPEIPEEVLGKSDKPLLPRFVFVGRWEPRKGLHIALDAFARFHRETPDAHLHVIGDPVDERYAEKVKSLASYREGLQKGWLTLAPGFAGPKSELYASASILLVPSLWENAPYVFSEAMAHGLIVLGTRTGEMIPAQEASHGILPQAGSVEAWHAALQKLWGRRDEAPRWRQKQWQWLRDRDEAASLQTLTLWRNWPGRLA